MPVGQVVRGVRRQAPPRASPSSCRCPRPSTSPPSMTRSSSGKAFEQHGPRSYLACSPYDLVERLDDWALMAPPGPTGSRRCPMGRTAPLSVSPIGRSRRTCRSAKLGRNRSANEAVRRSSRWPLDPWLWLAREEFPRVCHNGVEPAPRRTPTGRQPAPSDPRGGRGRQAAGLHEGRVADGRAACRSCAASALRAGNSSTLACFLRHVEQREVVAAVILQEDLRSGTGTSLMKFFRRQFGGVHSPSRAPGGLQSSARSM